MKKIFLIFVLLISLQGKAQTLNSIAVTAGASYGNQNFYLFQPNSISNKKYIFGYNASVFAEFFSGDYVRWVTEFQYNQKGSIDKQPEGNYTNSLQYISWNNYLKIRYELFSFIPYVLIGPRLDYNLVDASASPTTTAKFLPLSVSAAAGAGVEFVNYYNFKLFVEGFYNPDFMPSYIRPELQVFNKNFELRVGLKYEFAARKERCNTPNDVE